MMEPRENDSLVTRIAAMQDHQAYRERRPEGSFEEYLRLVRTEPRISRTAFQRLSDTTLSHGRTEYVDNKRKPLR